MRLIVTPCEEKNKTKTISINSARFAKTFFCLCCALHTKILVCQIHKSFPEKIILEQIPPGFLSISKCESPTGTVFKTSSSFPSPSSLLTRHTWCFQVSWARWVLRFARWKCNASFSVTSWKWPLSVERHVGPFQVSLPGRSYISD